MPIYEYRCTACGHELEVMQKMSDPAPAKCPKCEAANPFERLVSRTSFQLKGGGWYNDLYSSVKKDGAKPETSTTPATAAPASTTAPTTAPAAPAAAPAAAPSSGSSGSGSGSGGSSSGSSGS